MMTLSDAMAKVEYNIWNIKTEVFTHELQKLSGYAANVPTEKLFVKIQKDRDRLLNHYEGVTNSPSEEKSVLYKMYTLLINYYRKELRGEKS